LRDLYKTPGYKNHTIVKDKWRGSKSNKTSYKKKVLVKTFHITLSVFC